MQLRKPSLRIARVFCVAALLTVPPTFAEAADSVAPFAVSFGDVEAMGGPHAALAGGFSSLLSNPASLAAAKPELMAARLALKASGPIFDIANIMVSGGDVMTEMVDFLSANDYKLYTGVDIVGPLSFGYVGEGLGFGLFNATHASLNAASITSITAEMREDLLLVGGYAYRVDLGKGHVLDLGLLAKGFVRGEVSATKGVFEIESLLDPASLLGQPFVLTTGIGLDAGIRWDWERQVSAGLVCRDAYSPALVSEYTSAMDFVANPATALSGSTRSKIRPDLAVGAAWSPELGRLGRYIDGLVLALDYGDILDLARPVPRNAILNLGLGLEVRMLEILSVRLGFREALLAAGLGFDLGAFSLNAAAWGDELGIEPGARPVYNLLLSFDFVY